MCIRDRHCTLQPSVADTRRERIPKSILLIFKFLSFLHCKRNKISVGNKQNKSSQEWETEQKSTAYPLPVITGQIVSLLFLSRGLITNHAPIFKS